MGRLPVLRTDPTMTAAGYHSPESSVGSQSWSRDMSHGEAPLQVGSVAIVCEEQGKVKVPDRLKGVRPCKREVVRPL